MRCASFFIVAALATGALAAQGIEDALVIGSRNSANYHKISRGGEVLKVQPSQPSRNMRGVARAPDGKVWVVNFIQPNLTVLKSDLTVFLDVTGLPGNPSSIAFSKMDNAGKYRAYVVLNNTNQVLVFDEAAKQVGAALTITPTPNGRALGCAIDILGNLWVAIRANAGNGQLYKLNTQTNAFSGPFGFPVQSASLGGQVFCAPNLRIYAFGDGSRDVLEFDMNGKFQQSIVLPGGGSGLSDAAIDVHGTMWVTDYSNGALYQVDTKTLNLVKTHTDARVTTALAVAIDGEGGIWVIRRNSAAPSIAYKFNASGVIEQQAPVGLATGGLDDFTGYSYANIVDPSGDNDGDGEGNRAELNAGTNPFNAQSNSGLSLRTQGPQFIGKTVRLTLERSKVQPAPGLLAFGARAKPPLTIPILKGLLTVDLATFLPVATAVLLKGQSLVINLPLPNDASLAGIPLMFQGIVSDPTSNPRFVASDGEGFVIQK